MPTFTRGEFIRSASALAAGLFTGGADLGAAPVPAATPEPAPDL